MSYLLVPEIEKALGQIFSGTVFRDPAVEDETAEDAFIPPRIYPCALPPKRRHGNTNEDFPFIVARATEGSDQEGASEITTEIICGIYTAGSEADGGNDIHNILRRIRGFFLQNRIVGGRYELQLPVPWTTGTDKERNQPHPYYVGQITMTWRYFRFDHQESVDQELTVYGAGYR